MAIATVRLPDGRVADIRVPDDASPEQIQAYLAAQQQKADEFASQAAAGWEPPEQRGFGEELGRQAGLAGRAALQGVGGAVGVFSDPVAAMAEYETEGFAPGRTFMTGRELGGWAADSLGLPSPETPVERGVMAGAELMVPAGGTAAGAGRMVSRGTPVPMPTTAAAAAPTGPAMTGTPLAGAQMLATAPEAAMVGSATGGLAGQYVGETGGGPVAQLGAGIAGGFTGAAAMGGIMAAGRAVTEAVTGALENLRGSRASLEQINAVLQEALSMRGMNLDDIPATARLELTREMRKAMETGDVVDPKVLGRISDYAQLGVTPTRGTTTLDPVQITQERNLAKYGANSPNPQLQQMARMQAENDQILKTRLAEMGSDAAPDPDVAGAQMQAALRSVDAPRKAAVDRAYNAVRDSEGRYANIDVPAFSRMANDALDAEDLGLSLPAEAMKLLNEFSDGTVPLNVRSMAMADKRLSSLRRQAYRNGDLEGARAVQTVRMAMWQSPIESSAGEQASNLYHMARQMAAKRFEKIRGNPALEDALDDIAPDKFVQTYIMGGPQKASVRQVMALAKELKTVPEAFEAAKAQIIEHLKMRAMGAGQDIDATNFSPANFNRAMKTIGQSRLRAFFTREEYEQLKRIGRVATYEKFQPTGSAVNNSNTTAMAMGMIEKLLNSIASTKIPFLRVVASKAADETRGLTSKMEAGAALQPRFTGAPELPPAPRAFPSPAAFALPGAAAVGQE